MKDRISRPNVLLLTLDILIHYLLINIVTKISNKNHYVEPSKNDHFYHFQIGEYHLEFGMFH